MNGLDRHGNEVIAHKKNQKKRGEVLSNCLMQALNWPHVLFLFLFFLLHNEQIYLNT